MVEGESCDSKGDQQDNAVLIQRICLAEDSQVEKHHRQKLARLGQNKCQIVDVRKTGISKRRRQGRGDADQEQREENLASRKNGRNLLARRSREIEVEEASDRSKSGLYGVENDREGEALRRRVWFFGSWRTDWEIDRCDRFLKNTP